MNVTLKNFYFLTDQASGEVDAIIISEHSTGKDIEAAIEDMKEAQEYDWQWDDLVACLPDDCEIVDKWGGNLQRVYY